MSGEERAGWDGVQMSVESSYIQNSLRLMKGARPQGMSQLSGSSAANPTSAWSVYTRCFKS